MSIEQSAHLYKIAIALVGVLFGSWSLFGFFIVRWIRTSDDNFKELFSRTRVPLEEHVTNDLNRHIVFEEKMEKLKDRIYDNERLIAETSIKLDLLVEEHKVIHKKNK